MARTDPIAALIDLPEQAREKIIAGLSPDQLTAILYDWRIWARENQIAPPGQWSTWMCLAGRGWGKTRTGAEWVKDQVERHGVRRIALVAPTASDAREVMIEGESGLLSVFPPSERPLYEPSKRRVTFRNGAFATAFSAEKPGRLRGPQHDAAWCDEVCVWQYDRETWDNMQFGLRLGRDPRVCVTSTPRPTALLKEIVVDPSTVVSKGSTFENRANLAESFLNRIIRTYEGTRLGRQELYAEILEDVEGALWQRAWIEKHRVAKIKLRDLVRIVIAIDPAVTSKATSDETGIVAAARGVDGRGYVLDDASCRLSSNEWAQRAVNLMRETKADRIVAEVNNGGDLVERVIRMVDPHVPYKAVHASRGKIARAEPVATLYEQGRVSHVGTFAQLEQELCNYTGRPGEESPNRMDAVVWALSELFVESTTVTPKARWI